ncbi:flavodoxin domain-containing protein [Iamia majanohamensis]|uniref:Flavodoxin domain-containing protein n=1 Tax=Iamia majanohamensis TaxID=467976 RepID=A0AAE9Y506_9ACTN|nr:flavodoxin domain-containing protein [Iamia majanohamensis]WCO66544.1 flavodoxin domain-containing protein [Iamia majanohamensis]
MEVLVVHGAGRWDAAGPGRTVGAALAARGLQVDVASVDGAPDPSTYDALVVVGLQHRERWDHHLRQVLRQRAHALRTMPVWLVGVVPAGARSTVRVTAPVSDLGRLGRRVRARGVVTLDLDRAGVRPPVAGVAPETAHDHLAGFAAAVASELDGLAAV